MPQCYVAERHSIEGEKLVPGDIVLLEAGDKVPADLRLLKTHGLQIQEAILTGESVLVEKHIEPVPFDASLGDCSYIAFSGTLVTSGQGKGVVVATGASTEIGRISRIAVGSGNTDHATGKTDGGIRPVADHLHPTDCHDFTCIWLFCRPP